MISLKAQGCLPRFRRQTSVDFDNQLPSSLKISPYFRIHFLIFRLFSLISTLFSSFFGHLSSKGKAPRFPFFCRVCREFVILSGELKKLQDYKKRNKDEE
jgi:hypothetical protein